MDKGALGTTLNQAPTVFKRTTLTPKPVDLASVSSNPALAKFMTDASQSRLGSSPKTATTAAARTTTSTTTLKPGTMGHSKVVTTNAPSTNVTKIGATPQPKLGPRVNTQPQPNVEQQVSQFVRKRLIEQPKPRVAQPTANALLITNANKQITATQKGATTTKVTPTLKAPVNKAAPATDKPTSQPKNTGKSNQPAPSQQTTNNTNQNSSKKNTPLSQQQRVQNKSIGTNTSSQDKQSKLLDKKSVNNTSDMERRINNVANIPVRITVEPKIDQSVAYTMRGNVYQTFKDQGILDTAGKLTTRAVDKSQFIPLKQ